VRGIETFGYSDSMDALRPILDRDPRIAYALLFGSGAGARRHARSDVDIAIGLEPGDLCDTAGELDDLVRFCQQLAERVESDQ